MNMMTDVAAQGRETAMYHRKDASLDRLAQVGNVAQFVAYEPQGGGEVEQTFSRIAGCQPNATFRSAEAAVEELLSRSAEGSVNVRSYTPENPRSREFVYGIRNREQALAVVHRLAAEGLHVIVNETVDVEDGGVSGVAQGGIIEFAPDDTPRCVEKAGTASLPLEMGIRLLAAVYGFAPSLPALPGRVEFSVHPRARGWRGTHTLLWEFEEGVAGKVTADVQWPNRFSRHIGDKAYGLLIAHLAGAAVPHTLAIPRRVAPFSFGVSTGNHERWLRTCPREQEPGLFTTTHGWIDPFALLAREDPGGDRIASVLSQAAVPAAFAGAAIVDSEGRIVVEGVAGKGDLFMLGTLERQSLPEKVASDVRDAMNELRRKFGDVRVEWVHDGKKAWIVQLHRGATVSADATIVPGDPDRWLEFDAADGLEALRRLVSKASAGTGIRIYGEVGLTSHVADLLRKRGLPARVISAGG